MNAQRDSDRAAKRARLLEILAATNSDALVLTSAASLAWYLDGARIHVSLAADPLVAMRVSPDGDELVLPSNERDRLVAEELPDGLTLRSYDWYESAPVLDGLPESAVADALRAARRTLLPGELARYRALCAEAAIVLTDALQACTPEWTERQLSARVAQDFIGRGADQLVSLVAGQSRAAYPHPLPTDAPLGANALLVACARRDGLIVNISRSVAFAEPDAATRDRQRRILDVEAAAFDAMRPSVPLRDVLAAIARAYPTAGFDADQWRRHHQGGAAGYSGRDPRATPSVDDTIALGQVFSWNPWVPGAKVEDTVLLAGTDEHPVVESLTVDARWPTVDVAGRARPVPLRR